jgi:mono/diheme cytochrome c family protein
MILGKGQFDFKIKGARLVSKPLILSGALLALLYTGRADESSLSFNKDIRPILAEHCLHCHGPDGNKRKGDLRLDLEAEAKKEAIREGDPNHSPLYLRLITEDLDERMPPPDDGDELSAS